VGLDVQKEQARSLALETAGKTIVSQKSFGAIFLMQNVVQPIADRTG